LPPLQKHREIGTLEGQVQKIGILQAELGFSQVKFIYQSHI